MWIKFDGAWFAIAVSEPKCIMAAPSPSRHQTLSPLFETPIPINQAQWRAAFPQLIPDRNIMLNEKESVLPLTGNNTFTGEDPGYHSSPYGQTLIAANYYRRITQDFGLI